MGLAILDLDGTLVPLPTSQRRLFFQLVRAGLLTPGDALTRLAITGMRCVREGRQCAQASGAYLAGLSVASVRDEAQQLVENELFPELRPWVFECIEEHRRQGDYVVLVSGAPSFVVRAVAARLELDAAIGSEPCQEGGYFVDAPVLLHVAGERKRLVAESLCKWLSVPAAACTAYADSAEDRWLLAWTGRPVAVAPDAGLRRLARERRWECIEAV